MPLRLKKGLVTEFLLFRDQAACCFGDKAKMNHYMRVKVTDKGFEPGSTMKTFTIAAALDARAVRPTDQFDCMMGRLTVGKYTIHDTHPHGALTVAEIFKFSSNIGATKVARRLGRERFADALGRFGFGRPTGVGLPGERAGLLRPVDKWGDIGFANVSFGQGVTATPLQIVSGLAAIAAGGVYHPPRIVARVVRPDGSAEPLPERPAVRVISERAARLMTGIMLGVTEQGGTARAAAIDGYPVAGKTGTAQKVSGGHYDSSKWVSSFIGFAPAEQPRVAITVMVDEPQGGHLGGAVAAPVFKEIAEQALRYLHVPPQTQAIAARAGDRTKAAAKANDRSGRSSASEADDGADDEMPGSDVAELRDADLDDGEEAEAAPAPAPILAAMPDRDQDGDDADGAPPAQITIPNFQGLTIAAALRAARQSGVQLAFDEDRAPMGVALTQVPGPGPASRGAICRVSFGRPE